MGCVLVQPPEAAQVGCALTVPPNPLKIVQELSMLSPGFWKLQRLQKSIL